MARSQRSRHTRGLIVTAIIAAVAVAMGVLIDHTAGYAATSVTPDPQTVWVTNNADYLVGRVNMQIDELESAALMDGGGHDVLQDGRRVVVVDTTNHRVRSLDAATVTLGPPVRIPDNASVVLGNHRLAVADRTTGAVWTVPVHTLDGEPLTDTDPTFVAHPGVTLAASRDGTIAAVAPGASSVLMLRPGSDVVRQVRLPRAISGGSSGSRGGGDGADGRGGSPGDAAGSHATLSLTLVGDTPVVLDSTAHRLLTPQRTIPLPDGSASPVLQQPGSSADAVLVATTSALLRISLSDGAVQRFASGVTGAPVAPVWLDGCAHAAWSGTQPTYLRWCGSAPRTRPIPSASSVAQGGAGLVFRVNGDTVVLNDVSTGNVWVAGRNMVLINDWDQVAPQRSSSVDDSGQRDNSGAAELTLSRTDCSGGMSAPSAANDDYGIRAGRPTILRVMDNDAVSDCSVTRISKVSRLPGDVGTVHIVDGGTALQITTDADTTGRLPALTYRISDGAGHTDRATARVHIVPRGVHQPPTKLRDSATVLALGGVSTTNVLTDWVSPDGDPLFLTGAHVDKSSETVSFTADGNITVRDSGTGSPGKRAVEFTVSDGTDTQQGTLTVQVVATTDLVPVPSPVYAHTTTDTPVTVHPLDGVLSIGPDPLRLIAVSPAPGIPRSADLSVLPDTSTGTVSVSAGTPGTYYLTFQVASGSQTAKGVIRVDVSTPSDDLTPVPVVDTAYLPQGNTVRVDLVSNDVDPTGGVLAVQQVSTGSSPLIVTLSDMHIVTISARSALPPSGVWFSYTEAGTGPSATGWVHVVGVPPSVTYTPIASPISLTVRAGDAVTVAASSAARDPGGSALTVQPFHALPAGSGLLFAAGGDIRYLAPKSGPPEPITTSYTVTNTQGRSDSSTLQIRVVPRGVNHPPRTPPVTTARVFAGQTVAIGLPLDGVDPDGDWAIATGIAHQPGSGSAKVAGPSTVSYAAPDSPGTVTFEYTVTDPSGAHATGTVVVGVIARPDVVQPPVAPNLTATVAPGHSLAIDVLDSVTDPSGLPVTFADPGLSGPGPAAAVRGHISGRTVVVTAGRKEAVVPLTYTVQNSAGLTASGSITVTVSPDAPAVPPVAHDAYVTPDMVSADGHSALVDIGGLVSNPGGRTDQLTLQIPDIDRDAASKAGPLSVRVAVTDQRQVLAYQVVGADHLTASAFIVVPGRNEVVPNNTLPGPPRRTGSTRPPSTVQQSPPTTPVSTPPPTSAPPSTPTRTSHTTSPRTRARTHRTTTRRTRSTSTTHRSRRTSTSSTSRTAPTRTTRSTTSTTSTTPTSHRPPPPPAPSVSALQLSLQAGGARTIDLTGMVAHADRYAHLTFRGPRGAGHGISGTLNGRTLTVSADISVPAGTSVQLSVTIDDGVHHPVTGHVDVTVTATTAAPPVVPNRQITAQQGKPVTVNVLDGASNPLASKGPLTLVDATLTGGHGSVDFESDGTVTVTPAATETGTVTVLATATDPAGRSASGTLTVTVLGRPDPPTGVTVVGTADGSVTLSWAAPDDHGSAITHYLVSATGVNFDCRTRTTCTVTGLTNGQSYVFRVRARNGVGDSAPSAATKPVTPDIAPGAPGKPSVTAGNQRLDVSWAAPENHGSPIDHYEVTITPKPASGPATLSTTTTTATFAPLVNGTAYTVTVTAINATDTASPASEPSDPATPAAPPSAPSAPDLSFGQSGGSNDIDVSWSAPTSDGGDPNLTYTVQWTDSNGGSGSVDAATDRQATISGVSLGVQYTVAVVATNKAGSSGPGPSATITPATVPDQVTGLTATPVGGGDVTLAWTAPADNGRPITGYQYSTGDGWTSTGSGTDTTATLDDLTVGTDYTITVRACNGDAACGTASEPAPVNPYTAPGAVRTLHAYGTGTSGQIKVNWDAPSSDGGRDITGYQYRYKNNSTGASFTDWMDAPSGTDTVFTFSGRTNGDSYAVEVRAVNATASGDAGSADTHLSTAESDNAMPCRPPDQMAAPTGSHVTKTSIRLHWKAPFDGGRAIEKYQYRVKRVGSTYGAWTDAGSGTSHTVSGLKAGTRYRFRVRACNSVACGDQSNSTDITTDKPTPKPSLKLVHGPPYSGSGCSHGCYYLGIKYSHVKSGTYSVCFHFARETDSWCWRTYSVHLSGSGSWNTKKLGSNYARYGYRTTGKARLYHGGSTYVTSPAMNW